MPEDTNIVDVSDYIRDYGSEDSLNEALSTLATSEGFEPTFDNTYKHRPNMFPFLPGATDFALSYNGAEIKYNKKHLDGLEIYHALQDQEGLESDSWQDIKQVLTD
ncbi:hypothetical protein GLU26_00915 [Nanohaloarchaea archaeon]|nr:hypothetical protein [Candidatus Nanohaloarchaea archaeon]